MGSAVAALVWPPSQLVEGVAPLASSVDSVARMAGPR
jgi:hypothetical protein